MTTIYTAPLGCRNCDFETDDTAEWNAHAGPGHELIDLDRDE